MSRFRRASHNVVSSYVTLAMTALFGLAAVPMAWHYLREGDRFALWVMMSGITGYLSLIDLGMSSSVARLLVDYKDRRDGGEYGSLIKTGWLVLLVQGGLILLVGLGLAPMLATLLKVQPALQTEFIQLLGWQSAALALGFAVRIFSHLLNAHQRTDIYNYSQSFSLILHFILLWGFFAAGHGVLSLAWAGVLSGAVSGLLCFLACRRLKLFPAQGAWGRVTWRRFRELFDFGTDMFLVAVGAQLIMASQTLIIQRTLAEGATILWGFGTKLFFLVSQVIWRISDVAGPAFSEMIVRGERKKLQTRYKEMVMLTASMSAFLAVGYGLCNSTFATLLSHGDVVWPPVNDLALGIWMIVLALLHCHNGFVLLTKQIGFMRYVYFVEGLVFVMAALLVAKSGGLLAVVLCSILCSCLFSGSYGTWRVHRYFNLPIREVGWHWLALMGRTLLLYAPLAYAGWWIGTFIEHPFGRLAIYALVYGPAGLYLFLRYGLTPGLQQELSARAPKAVSPFLRRIFAAA